jgi:hypothetical protein
MAGLLYEAALQAQTGTSALPQGFTELPWMGPLATVQLHLHRREGCRTESRFMPMGHHHHIYYSNGTSTGGSAHSDKHIGTPLLSRDYLPTCLFPLPGKSHFGSHTHINFLMHLF